MWFTEEPSQFSAGQTAQSLTCSMMEEPHTGLDDCLNMLLPCFRKRMSGLQISPFKRRAGRGGGRKKSVRDRETTTPNRIFFCRRERIRVEKSKQQTQRGRRHLLYCYPPFPLPPSSMRSDSNKITNLRLLSITAVFIQSFAMLCYGCSLRVARACLGSR